MWIVLRLLVFAVAIVLRLRRQLFPPAVWGERDGKLLYAGESLSGDNARGQRIGVEFRVPVVFRLQRESASDRFFKSIGYAREFQTKDQRFDDAIYIASDHPAVFDHLSERADTRQVVLDAIESGYHRISTDGRFLWVETPEHAGVTEADAARLLKLRAAFADIGRYIRLRRDPFLWRAIIVEAFTWPIALFAFSSLVEQGWNDGDVHADQFALVKAGLGLSLIAFVLLVFGIRAFLGQSSRGHRFLVESAAVLLFGLPVASTILLADFNRSLDRSEPMVLEREIVRRYSTVHRGRRGRRYRRYHLEFSSPATAFGSTIPQTHQLSYADWIRMPEKGAVRMEVRPGRFGFVWYGSPRLSP